MRKEVFIAILIGIILGGTVAFGIWRANIAFLPKKEVNQTEQLPTTTVSAEQQSSILITQPENNSIVPENKVIIKGATTPNSTVVLLTPADEEIVQSDKDGAFEQEVELEGGPNEIKILSYDSAGNEQQATLMVVYSTEFTKEQ